MKYSEAPVELTLAPSRIAVWTVAAMALSTAAVLVATPGPAWFRILLATWVACAALEAIHAAALHRGRRGVCHAVVTMAGEVHLRSDVDEWRTGVIRPGSFVASWLTIIRWRAPAHRFDRTLLIPDMLPEEDFRRLRVLLRWGL
jgi:hypothetical protein